MVKIGIFSILLIFIFTCSKTKQTVKPSHEKRLEQIRTQIYMLEAQIEHENISLAEVLDGMGQDSDSATFAGAVNLISTPTTNINIVKNQLFSYSQELSNVIYYISAIQDQLIDKQAEYLELLLEEPVERIMDPCNDMPLLVDEFLYQTQSNRVYIFYATNGKRRSATLLNQGEHVTLLDACKFYVPADGEVRW